jgi:serine/threonine protein kinase/formylglycine-generating enzyme required for sulfatase activity
MELVPMTILARFRAFLDSLSRAGLSLRRGEDMMPKTPRAPAPDPDLDDGTWNPVEQSEIATPPANPPQPKERADDSSKAQLPEAPDTVPAAHHTHSPTPTAGEGDLADKDPADKDSADNDSAESTPTPGHERSDEWDLLPTPTIEKGRLVFGKYLLDEKLGEGGMGQVWRVENVSLQRESALKLIKQEIAQNDKGWRRFEREARLMAKITHPNAVGVHDFRRTHSLGYIEMEYVAGASLHDFLKRRKGEPMPLDWIAQFLDQLCSVLQAAHQHVDKKTGKARPIVHRDLKPSNLMLAEGKPPGQELKVLDFGIAKIAEDEGSPELTGVGEFLGTPDYMSPEQIRGGITRDGKGGIDGRSDLYSTGVLLYQLLTGKLPFPAMNKMAVLGAHLHSPPMPMKEANPGARIPPPVERLVMKCLEKDPDRRPQTARELAEQFRKAIAGFVPSHEKVRWRIPVLPITAACVVVAGLLVVAPRVANLVGSRTAAVTPEGPGKPPDPSNIVGPTRAADRAPVWVPAGFEIAEPFEPAPDSPDEALRIRRISDHVEFYRLRTGAYLPVLYRPESDDLTDMEGAWPRVIIRTLDKARFLRIPGKKYHRGDTRVGRPALDYQRNPCAPHWVELSGFYIQETEVTHEQIEKYLEVHPEAAENLKSWEAYYKSVRKKTNPEANAKRYPAACIGYLAARQYARDMAGQLPTEAQWEFAAKSCTDDFLFPWGKMPARGERPKANISSPNNSGGLAFVGSFSEDRTDQHVLDMAGNVRELCLDAYEPYSSIINAGNSTDHPLRDPCVCVEPRPDNSVKFVVKGGSFQLGLLRAMAFQRDRVAADDPTDDIGFRIVVECPPTRGTS